MKDNSLSTLLSQVDIINIISNFLELKKVGSAFFSKCPFHKEKTASFYVNKNTQKYNCFGCNKHGNVIDFIIHYKKCTFKDALTFIINLSTVAINNNFNNNKLKPLKNKYEPILNEFNFLLKNYLYDENQLLNFLKKRKLKYKTISDFNIGFVPYNIKKYLNKFHINDFINLGFIKENNLFYNRFKNRIIFPIKNVKGDIIGVGGRTIYDNIKPKYINSPESDIFSKRKELYGLYESLIDKKSNHIIIVEGYFDVITLHQNNITNVAAILGTAFSKEHILVLKNFYKEIFFCYDGDRAGRLASLRTAYLCLPFLFDFINIKFLIIPNGFDPDSFIKKFNINKFFLLFKDALFVLDFIFFSIINLKKNDFNKFNFLKMINKLLLNIKNDFLKKFITDYFAKLIYKDEIILLNSNYISSIGIKACLFLLKDKSLINDVNIFKVISNKKIKFHSDINIFLDLFFLLKNNKNLNYSDINKMLIKKIIIKNLNYLLFLKKIDKKTLKEEFFYLIEKIINI